MLKLSLVDCKSFAICTWHFSFLAKRKWIWNCHLQIANFATAHGHLLILLLKTQESGILQFAHDGIDS